jgi:long-chain acyl-CoA synthetase
MFLELDKKTGVAAIDDEGRKLSFQELREFSEELYLYLKGRTLVFILSENDVGALAAYTAALSKNVVPLVLSANTDRQLLIRLIETYQPEFLWAPNQTDVPSPFESVFEKYAYRLYKTNLRSPKLYRELSLLLSTSGSTGSPKLVRHSYENLEQSARSVAQFFEITSDDRPVAMLPMHYTMGLSVINSHLYSGATLLLTKRSLTESAFWKLAKDEKATSLTGVPYSFEVLSKLRFFRMDLPHLKLITQGGGKLKDELFKAFADYAVSTNK